MARRIDTPPWPPTTTFATPHQHGTARPRREMVAGSMRCSTPKQAKMMQHHHAPGSFCARTFARLQTAREKILYVGARPCNAHLPDNPNFVRPEPDQCATWVRISKRRYSTKHKRRTETKTHQPETLSLLFAQCAHVDDQTSVSIPATSPGVVMWQQSLTKGIAEGSR